MLAVLAAALAPVLGRVLDRDAADRAASVRPLVWTRQAVALLLLAALFSMAAEVMFVVFGAWLEDSFGLSLVALGGAGFLVGLAELGGEGSTLAFGDRIGLERATAIGLVLSIIGFGAIGLEPSGVAVAMAMVVVAFFGFEFTIVSAIPLAADVAPAARSRFLALWAVAIAVGRAAGALLGTVVFETFGVAGNAALAVAANVLALAVLLAGVTPPPRSEAAPPAA